MADPAVPQGRNDLIYRYLTGISKPRDLRERKMVGKYLERPLQLTKTSALTSGLLRGASYPH